MRMFSVIQRDDFQKSKLRHLIDPSFRNYWPCAWDPSESKGPSLLVLSTYGVFLKRAIVGIAGQWEVIPLWETWRETYCPMLLSFLAGYRRINIF